MRKTFALVHLHHPRRQTIEKITVVRHKNDRPSIRSKKFFKPTNRLRIQMVGRLVQQQQVRLRHNSPSQRHPTLLPTRKRAH